MLSCTSSSSLKSFEHYSSATSDETLHVLSSTSLSSIKLPALPKCRSYRPIIRSNLNESFLHHSKPVTEFHYRSWTPSCPNHSHQTFTVPDQWRGGWKVFRTVSELSVSIDLHQQRSNQANVSWPLEGNVQNLERSHEPKP